MLTTLSRVLKGMPLDLDCYHRPVTVGPCLSDAADRKCGTAEKVGYRCYGCIGAKFPVNKPLFRHVERRGQEKPFDPSSDRIYLNYGRQAS
jgi:hypothetical protein